MGRSASGPGVSQGKKEVKLFSGFAPFRVGVSDGVHVAGVKGGNGPPLLLLHGHPQTHAMWHRVAPDLASRFFVVAPDLRGYGDSSKPKGSPDHATHSKRAMAADQVGLMNSLGFSRFSIVGHDRGGRVAHRLAVDHPQAVQRLVLLDIAPTLAMYEQTTMEFATAYWHWFFLIQPAPLPERLIGADPDFYLTRYLGNRTESRSPFDAEAFAEYQRCFRDPGTIHGICEDYRASATIDLEHDRSDRASGRRIGCPVLALWGAKGVVARCFDVLSEWRRVADEVGGEALECGHYIPEEDPERLLRALFDFLPSD
jgi:haloacetate dehalogenase